ncbi:MAG: prephenate dehydratase [Dehalococcoidia bacterium]|nr:prephenate dehydratase [Dehalococcoidia bacterium]
MIEELRAEIDAADAKLVALIAQRLRLAAEIGQAKKEAGQPVVDPAREVEVLARVSELARQGGLDERTAETFFRQLIKLARGTQSASVAFQGEPGAYSQQAAHSFFSSGVCTLPRVSLAEVFAAVGSGEADYGAVPIENSLEGSICQTYDLLLESDLAVAGEVEVRVTHCLIANPGTTLDSIRKVYSHPQALGQCQSFLQHMGWEMVPTYDTAGSVKMIKEKELADGAAIASAEAASIYGMHVLRPALEDNPHNFTRFFILAREDAPPTGNDKTSLVFSVKHQPGTLYGFLGELAKNGLNLTKIESRPTRRTPWEYNFYLDFEGHRRDEKGQTVIEGLANHTTFLKVLGSYPRANGMDVPCI